MAKLKRFPTYNVNMGDAILVVKHHLDDENIAMQTKVLSIETVANMETLNSVTKDELQRALQWLFKEYDFGEG